MPDYFEAGVVQQTDSSVPELPQAYLNGCLSVSDRMSPGKPALIHASQFDICSVLELEEIRDSMLHLWLSDRSNFGRSLSSNPGQSMEVDVSSLSGKRVLVTGGGGFIGSHLAERLVSEGAHTRALVHYRSDGSRGWLEGSLKKNEIEVIAGDVCDSEIVVRAMRQTDVVFHLAALIGIPYSYDAPRSYVHTNVTGTLNVLQAARDLEIQRVVHTSTSEVYGSAQYVPIDEKHPLQAQSPYSASKIGAEKLAEAFYLSFELPVVTVRPFNTFGPRQSARAVIPTIISQCLKSRSVKIGRLHPTRDLNFVQNTGGRHSPGFCFANGRGSDREPRLRFGDFDRQSCQHDCPLDRRRYPHRDQPCTCPPPGQRSRPAARRQHSRQRTSGLDASSVA